MSISAPERQILDNGIQVVAQPIPGAQSVVVIFRFIFGAKDDPAERLGMACIAEDALFKGTPNRDARAIFDAFDTLGVRRGASTGVEHTEFRAQLLPRHFQDTAALYAEIFRSASFPDDQVEISKAITLEELKRLEDDPIQHVLFLTYLAGLGDPMGRIPLGEPETVRAITARGVRNYWTAFCRPENLLISVAGGLDAPDIFQALGEAFGGWYADAQVSQPPHHLSVASRTVHHPKASEQEHIGMLFGAAPRGHTLYYPAQLAVAVLSGSGSSRLFTEVREKRGLAYSVAAFYRARRDGGLIALYAGTTADRADETLAVCQQEILRLARDAAQDELDRAKTVLKGRLFTTGDLPDGRAGGLIEDLFHQQPLRSIDDIARGIDGVTLDQIPAYLEAFPPEPRTLVTLGPRPLQSA